MPRPTGGWPAALCLVASMATGIVQAQSTPELFDLAASDGRAGDDFGRAVAIDADDTALVGAPGDTSLGDDAGAVRVYTRDVLNRWRVSYELRGSQGFAGDRFGFAVAVSGDVAAVGAPGDPENGPDAGAVYVFGRNATSGTWVETARLTPTDGTAADGFGASVQVRGNTLVVGAPGDDDRGRDSGSVHVFRRGSGGDWSALPKLAPSDGVAGARFGHSLALFSQRLAIGSPGDDDRGPASGSVHVHEPDAAGTAWPLAAKLTARDGRAGDRFGTAVALSFERVLVGAPGADASGEDSGAAYLLRRDDASGLWSHAPRFVGADTGSGDAFGEAVAMTTVRWVVGAPGNDDDPGRRSGAAYLFDGADPDAAPQLTKLLPRSRLAGDFFGIDVAMWSDVALVGAPGADGRAFDTGAAFVFELAGRYAVGLGAYAAGGGGWMQERLSTRLRADRGFPRLPWPAYNAANGETRPALCDLDGDDRHDVVTGLGPGGGGYLHVRLGVGNTRARWLRIPWASYNAANGETFVACGDVDDDGRDEIIAGLGTGGQGNAYAFDDFLTGYAPIDGGWLNIAWPDYASASAGAGAVHPAVGNLDGDPYEEVVLGTGAGGSRWFRILDDADNGFAPGDWHRAADTASIPADDHEVWPAVCHGRRIVLGASSASGSGGGGWLNLRTRSGGTYRSGWANLTWPAYAAVNGATRPACGDLDLDGKAELLVGLGAGGEGYVAVFDDSLLGPPRWERIDWSDYALNVGATWPAAR